MPDHHLTTLLHPHIPLLVRDTPLHTCMLLAEVRLHELAYWPRRHVAAIALCDGSQPAPGRPVRVISLLCLN